MRAVRAARRRLQLRPLVLLTGLWVMLWGSLTWGNVVLGFVVAAVVLVVFPLPVLHLRLQVRPVALVVLLTRFFVDLATASVQVAYQAVAPWVHPQGRLIRVGLRSDDELLTTLTAQMTGLVPGTLVLECDPERRELLVHLFDAPTQADLDAACRTVHAQEDRVLAALAGGADRRVPTPRETP